MCVTRGSAGRRHFYCHSQCLLLSRTRLFPLPVAMSPATPREGDTIYRGSGLATQRFRPTKGSRNYPGRSPFLSLTVAYPRHLWLLQAGFQDKDTWRAAATRANRGSHRRRTREMTEAPGPESHYKFGLAGRHSMTRRMLTPKAAILSACQTPTQGRRV